MTSARPRALSVIVGAAWRPIQGEIVSGDTHAVLPWSSGVLVAVIDGLGHGPRAASASAIVAETVKAHADAPLESLFFEVHRAALGSRGAVAAVARVDEHEATLEVAGLGNIGVLVEHHASSRSVHAPLVPGVLGSSYRAVRPQTFALSRGDRVLLYSDGIRSRIDMRELRGLAPQAAMDSLLISHGKPTDDALCLMLEATSPNRPSLATQSSVSIAPGPEGGETIPVRIPGDPEAVAVAARRIAQGHGFSVRAQWEVSIAASELATNILKHGESGEVRLAVQEGPVTRFVVDARDWGPGLGDPAAAQRDGYSRGADRSPDELTAGQGLGVGLGSVQRMMDEVTVTSPPGRGTRIVATKRRVL